MDTGRGSMVEQMKSKEKSRMRNAVIALLATLALGAAVAVPVQASQPISFYQLSTSNTEAGGHPDITTKFTLLKAGSPEVPKTIEANWPEGVFGNPQAVPRCSPSDFAKNECPSFSQIGWVAVQ